MRKILCMVLVACILLTAVGCNGGNTGNTPPDSTTGSGKAESTQSPSQQPTAGSPSETAQTDPSKMSFKYTTVSPDWKVIEESNVDFDYTLMEDERGILHLINTESRYLYHRYQVAGVWSQPKQIVGETMQHKGYWVGAAPDGNPCVVWKDFEFIRDEKSGRNDGTEVLHIKRYVDNEWREDPKTYAFKDPGGTYLRSIDLYDVAFDTQGEPHFLYTSTIWADSLTVKQEEEPINTQCLFLDGYQLTKFDTYQYEVAEKMPEQFVRSVVQGIGDMCDSVRFYIDSGNVYHLMYCDESTKVPESYRYTAYHHSYSRDGGETWEGPFVLFENRMDIYENGNTYKQIEDVSIYEDSEGNLQIPVILSEIHPTSILTVSLKAGTFEAMPERFFGGEETRDALLPLPLEETSKYHGMQFQTVLSDSGGNLHFITNGVNAQPWVISWIEENTWALRDIEQPEEDANLVAIFQRRNGNFALLSKEYGKGLYYAEIPAER